MKIDKTTDEFWQQTFTTLAATAPSDLQTHCYNGLRNGEYKLLLGTPLQQWE